MSIWHALHFNTIAKEIREQFPLDSDNEDIERPTRALRKAELLAERTALTRLALSFAHRFNDKNIPFFDPLRFLDACSPNTDLYPLSEMWEE